MPGPGDYLLTHVGFSKDEKPILLVNHNQQVIPLTPLESEFTIKFDTSVRYCRGWYDIEKGEDYPCPDSAEVDQKYDQCPACQNRTGFNPAFYHAVSVSKQQEQRNLQPHVLYLAWFGKDVVKVGISYAARGNGRLLEQGARSALVLDTFPSAHIARQYEAQIAALPNIVETVQLRKKIELLAHKPDTDEAEKELLAARTRIEERLTVTFTRNDPLHLDKTYFPAGMPDLSDSFDCSPHYMISGTMTGALGSLFFCRQQDTPLFLPMKKYVGYRFTLTHEVTPIDPPARQISLF